MTLLGGFNALSDLIRMPNKHVYFALGVTHGAFLVTWMHYRRRDWFKNYRWMRQLCRFDPDWFLYFPWVLACFGCFGLIPDVILALDLLPKEKVRSDLFNVFYGYSLLEHIEDKRPDVDHLLNTFGSLILYTVALGVLAFYARVLLWRINNVR